MDNQDQNQLPDLPSPPTPPEPPSTSIIPEPPPMPEPQSTIPEPPLMHSYPPPPMPPPPPAPPPPQDYYQPPDAFTQPGQGYVPPPHEFPPQAYYQPPQANPGNGQSIASLILGICSLVFIGGGLILPLIGLILGVIGKRKALDVGAPTGMATAGIVMSIIAIIFSVLWIICIIGICSAALYSPEFLDLL
jgi:hypothetical protein